MLILRGLAIPQVLVAPLPDGVACHILDLLPSEAPLDGTPAYTHERRFFSGEIRDENACNWVGFLSAGDVKTK